MKDVSIFFVFFMRSEYKSLFKIQKRSRGFWRNLKIPVITTGNSKREEVKRMQTDQLTIANEQTIVFDGPLEEAPKPFLLKFLTPIVAQNGYTGTGSWSTGDDDGEDYLDT